jgi:hypothetical protein
MSGIDLTLTLGDIVTAAAFVGGIVLAAGGLRGKLREHDVELIDMKTDIKSLATDMRTMADKMTELVKFSGRLDRMDDRAILQGQRIDEGNKLWSKVRDDIEELRRERYGAPRPNPRPGG